MATPPHLKCSLSLLSSLVLLFPARNSFLSTLAVPFLSAMPFFSRFDSRLGRWPVLDTSLSFRRQNLYLIGSRDRALERLCPWYNKKNCNCRISFYFSTSRHNTSPSPAHHNTYFAIIYSPQCVPNPCLIRRIPHPRPSPYKALLTTILKVGWLRHSLCICNSVRSQI